MDNNGLTHFDGEGNAIMVDVSGKDVTSTKINSPLSAG